MSASDTRFSRSTTVSFDPGLTQQYTGVLNRVVNKNGAFNIRRADAAWSDLNPYTFLISVPWPVFAGIVIAAFIVVNVAFAWIYGAIGAEHIKGTGASSGGTPFWSLFFFSAHTLTTVGYGNMYPDGALANGIASLEALLGLMSFAIATGLLFGRFSRPSARFGFSERMALAPYHDGTSLQFRVVNRRSNNLIEVEARVMLMTVEVCNGLPSRRYTNLELERNQVLFLPLTWTVVHPIIESSPLFGKTAEDLMLLQAEVVIMMRGYDETFGQIVYARYSYRFDEIEWGAKFASAFEVDARGDMLLWVDRVGLTEPALLPGMTARDEA